MKISMDDADQNHPIALSVVAKSVKHRFGLKALDLKFAPFAQLYLNRPEHLQSIVDYYDKTIPINPK